MRVKEKMAIIVAAFVVTSMVMTAVMAQESNLKGAPESVPGEKIVKFQDGTLKLIKDTEFEALSATESVAVEYMEPNYIIRGDMVPNDPMSLSHQWQLNNIVTSYENTTGVLLSLDDADIDAFEAWFNLSSLEDGSAVVALLDTGVDYNHPDLARNIWINPGEIPGNGIDDDGNGYVDDTHGWDFVNSDNNPMDDHGHGTHNAGTMAAECDNGIGICGVGYNKVRVMILKVLDFNNEGKTYDAYKAIQYAKANGAKIISMSWHVPYNPIILDEIVSSSPEILFVASAGNGQSNNDLWPVWPAGYSASKPNVVSVAATNRVDKLYVYSNYGAKYVDLGAPGQGIWSTLPNGSCAYCSRLLNLGYAPLSGTSMAVPHVSAVGALLRGLHPGLSIAEIKKRILDSVDPIESLSGITVTGGRLNAAKALVNNPPVAINQELTMEKNNKALLIELSAVVNDTDKDKIYFEMISSETGQYIHTASGGTVALSFGFQTSGEAYYIPPYGFTGRDVIRFIARDGFGDMTLGTIIINVIDPNIVDPDIVADPNPCWGTASGIVCRDI